MKGPEYVLLFCTVIMAERRKEYPRPSRNLIKISRQKDPSLREKARDGFTNI